jgi:hypothetical protein
MLAWGSPIVSQRSQRLTMCQPGKGDKQLILSSVCSLIWVSKYAWPDEGLHELLKMLVEQHTRARGTRVCSTSTCVFKTRNQKLLDPPPLLLKLWQRTPVPTLICLFIERVCQQVARVNARIRSTAQTPRAQSLKTLKVDIAVATNQLSSSSSEWEDKLSSTILPMMPHLRNVRQWHLSVPLGPHSALVLSVAWSQLQMPHGHTDLWRRRVAARSMRICTREHAYGT